jgi:hypothetical protein
MLARLRPLGTVLFAALVLGMLAPGTASARTYTHELNVWSDGVTLGEGDEVRGDVNVIFGTLVCDGPATIDGDVNVIFGQFDPQGQCTVKGTLNPVFPEHALPAFAPWMSDSDAFFHENRGLMRKLGWDLVVVLAFLLFPMRMRVALDRVEKHPGMSVLAGGVAIVGAIPIAVILAISVIGWPLIPLEFVALFAGLWIGQGAVALLLGRRFYELVRPQATPSPLAALALGLVLITAAEVLPFVGWLVTGLVALMGLGAATLAFVRETSFHSFGPTFGGPPIAGSSGPIGGPPMTTA